MSLRAKLNVKNFEALSSPRLERKELNRTYFGMVFRRRRQDMFRLVFSYDKSRSFRFSYNILKEELVVRLFDSFFLSHFQI